MTWTYLKAFIAWFFLQLPPAWHPPESPPETSAQRDARLEVAGAAAASAALNTEHGFYPLQAAAIVGTIWYAESRNDYHVHAGSKSPIGHQDHGKAKCLGQIQTWPGNTLLTEAQWQALTGADYASTQRCADATVSYLWYHAQRCLRRKMPKNKRWQKPLDDGEVARLFAAYGEGKCVPVGKSTKDRMRLYFKAKRMLPRESARLAAE